VEILGLIKNMMIPGIVLAVALVMMFVESRRSGRNWPKVRGWWSRALLLNGVQVGSVWIAGAGWNGWMLQHRPWNADVLGVNQWWDHSWLRHHHLLLLLVAPLASPEQLSLALVSPAPSQSPADRSDYQLLQTPI
jgi:hypothetical protein